MLVSPYSNNLNMHQSSDDWQPSLVNKITLHKVYLLRLSETLGKCLADSVRMCDVLPSKVS